MSLPHWIKMFAEIGIIIVAILMVVKGNKK